MQLENGAHLIPETNLEQLRLDLAKLVKRAKRIGVEAIEITEGEHIDFPLVKPHGEANTEMNASLWDVRTRGPVDTNSWKIVGYRRYVPVSVTGESPRYAGWILAGTIQPIETEDGKEAILRIAGDIEMSQEQRDYLRSRFTYCDHCKTDRRRNDVYAVKHEETGEVKAVGSSCIKDFLGHENPESLVSMAEYLAGLGDLLSGAEEDDYYGFGSGRPSAFDVDHVLAMGACVIRKDGFTSAKAVRERGWGESTGAQVFGILLTRPSDTDYQQIKRDYLDAITEEDAKLAQDARDWARTLSGSDNEYLYTLSVMARSVAIGRREMGYAVSMIQAYRKEMLNIEEGRTPLISEHFGTVGERIKLTLIYLGLTTKESAYGVTTIIRFRTEDGRRITWFASGEHCAEWYHHGGKPFDYTATIKSHAEYGGNKVTYITRVTEYVEKVKKPRAKKAQPTA